MLSNLSWRCWKCQVLTPPLEAVANRWSKALGSWVRSSWCVDERLNQALLPVPPIGIGLSRPEGSDENAGSPPGASRLSRLWQQSSSWMWCGEFQWKHLNFGLSIVSFQHWNVMWLFWFRGLKVVRLPIKPKCFDCKTINAGKILLVFIINSVESAHWQS